MLIAPLRQSELLPFLNRHMPAGMMVILVAYTLVTSAPHAMDPRPVLVLGLATAVTAVVHLWRRNFLLSILTGTGVHVVLASTLPST